MGLFKVILFLLLFWGQIVSGGEETAASHILYLMQVGEVDKSLENYLRLAKEKGQNFELVQKMAALLLQKGIETNDPEVEQLTIFGAGLAASSYSLPILEKGLASKNLQTSLMSLHFISLFQDDRSDQLIEKTLSSDFLMARLEALYVMAQKKHPHALGQIESLMHRLPIEAKPIFPSLFALVGTPSATPFLKELLNDANPQVRIEALLSIGRFDRDELLTVIRQRGSHPSMIEKEALCSIFGFLKDSSSIPLLKKLSENAPDPVKIAAAASLVSLGDEEGALFLCRAAEEGNPFAISLLALVPKTEELLLRLLQHKELEIRLNATIALLKKRDERALFGLQEILLLDKKHFLFMPAFSPGRALQAWKVMATPSFYPKNEEEAILWEISLNIKELFLKLALDLPEKTFLQLAETLFDHQINELVPSLVHALENLATPAAIDLLKKQSHKTGAPLIRAYANLALFCLKEEGPYEEHVFEWVKRQGDQQLIRIRPYVPWKNRIDSLYVLSAEESSRLLIESYSALAESHKSKSIALLLQALSQGHRKNRFLLAALLLRATE